MKGAPYGQNRKNEFDMKPKMSSNYDKSGVNMLKKDSPAEFLGLLGTVAKGVGKVAKVAGKTIGKGVKAVGKAVKGGGKAAKAGAKAGEKAGKLAETTAKATDVAGKTAKAAKTVTNAAKKATMGDKLKEAAIGSARDVVTNAATQAITPKEKEVRNPTESFNVKFGN